MSLAERLTEARKPTKPRFEQWVDELPEQDRDALIQAATDPDLSNRAILDAVRAEGFPVSKDTISVWRKKHGYEPR